MNILYFADADITINKGGVNRVTHFLSREFMKIPAYNCHLAYLHPSKILPVSEFDGKLHLTPENPYQQLKEYIQKQGIRIVILNLTIKKNSYFVLPILQKVKKDYPALSVIFCYHTRPGCELAKTPWKYITYKLRHRQDFQQTLRQSAFNLAATFPFRYISTYLLSRKYKFIYTHCDRLVLLSKHYIPCFQKFIGRKTPHHLIAIPNPLSLPNTFSEKELSEKRKEVLIVARLSEPIKRLSLALQIWKIIEANPAFEDWQLTIVGNGEDEAYYRQLASRHQLKHISFEGRQNPIEYYRHASIFMMTSLYEGWGLTLTESQQMGVVPIAFNSFEALQDIIRNKENGILVPEGDIRQYARQLMLLMKNESDRHQMAKQALDTCQQYSMPHIVRKWQEIFAEQC